MPEKISDAPIRKGKIDQLRNKVLTEISDVRKILIERAIMLDRDSQFLWTEFAREYTALDLMEKYFRDRSLFTAVATQYLEFDYVTYHMSTDTIDRMLDDECNVVVKWLEDIERHNGYGYISRYLNHDYFEYDFFLTYNKFGDTASRI